MEDKGHMGHSNIIVVTNEHSRLTPGELVRTNGPMIENCLEVNIQERYGHRTSDRETCCGMNGWTLDIIFFFFWIPPKIPPIPRRR